jgi:NAD+ synthase (glutamine-hydrolysing)
MRLVKVACGSINSKVCDFEGNVAQIEKLINMAEKDGARLLVTPELGITGYSLGDRVQWNSVIDESYKAIEYLKGIIPDNLFVFVGAPVRSDFFTYNGLWCLTNGEVRGVTLKRNLPSYDVFYEGRNFDMWGKSTKYIGASEKYVGNLMYSSGDLHNEVMFAAEICEDLWTENNMVEEYVRDGCEIIVNGSASPFSPGKAETRENLISATSNKNICVYCYANLSGLEERVVFGGDLFISVNGKILRKATSIGNKNERYISAVVDLDDIRIARKQNTTFRSYSGRPISRNNDDVEMADGMEYYKSTPKLINNDQEKDEFPENCPSVFCDNPFLNERSKEVYEEVLSFALSEYYRKNKVFEKIVIALSGGLDSTLCLLIAYDAAYRLGKNPKEIIDTFYLKHNRNSSERTFNYAKKLAECLGVNFFEKDITDLCDKNEELLGENVDDITKQNIQARVRGAFTLNYANKNKGLVIVTSNLSEAAVGYCTTGGDNQGGFSLISDIPKTFVRHIVLDIANANAADPTLRDLLRDIAMQNPSAELKPDQTDEEDLMPYNVLDYFLDLFAREKRGMDEIFKMAIKRYADTDVETLYKYAVKFITKIAANQWKRDQHPVGVRVLGMDLDPKSGFRFPVIQSVEFELKNLKRVFDEELAKQKKECET